MGTKPLIGVVRELLRLVADAGVELHFEELTGLWLDPLTVDALVVLTRPGILEFVQFKVLIFQAPHVRPDSLSVVRIPILEGIPDRVRNQRSGILRRAATFPNGAGNLFFDAVLAF